MKTNRRKIDASFLAPLLLFTIFTLCVVLVLLMGAKVYETAVDRDQRSFDHRTAVQYLSNRVRQLDCDGAWFVGDFYEAQPQEAGNTLYFREIFRDEVYYTRIYCHDGYLYELSSIADGSFEPTDGEKILAMNALQFSKENGMLKIHFRHTDGKTAELFLALRSEMAVAP